MGCPYVLYVHGNNDTTGAVRAVESITTGLRWKRLRDPVTARRSRYPDLTTWIPGVPRSVRLQLAEGVVGPSPPR
nr:hypothetical protein [Protofrankia symbiont of Coriaria ruscifolia]